MVTVMLQTMMRCRKAWLEYGTKKRSAVKIQALARQKVRPDRRRADDRGQTSAGARIRALSSRALSTRKAHYERMHARNRRAYGTLARIATGHSL